MIRIFMVCVALQGVGRLAAGAFGADWPQWGGRDDRNMVAEARGLPDTFVPGEKDPQGGGIKLATTRNVQWTTRLGSYAYGNPTVAGGRVFVGTDLKTLDQDARFQYRKGGLVKCLDAATGKLLWQLVTPERKNLPAGMHFSQQHLGTCSSVTVEGRFAYVVTSAGEVVCLDVEGQANGNAGPFLDEGQYLAGAGQPPVAVQTNDADIVWRFDLIAELGVHIHDAASCSVLIHGDLVYAVTCNGVDASHEKVRVPQAPALIALDKRTGRLAAREEDGISGRLFHAQWSSPSLGVVNGRPLIFLGGGDGFCYAFEALAKPSERPVALKKVWSYDCNPPHYRLRDGQPLRYTLGDKRKKESPNKDDGLYVGPSDLIATPVFHRNRVYVGIGQDPAHGRGRGMFHCIDTTQTGDITRSDKVWSYDGLERTMATAAVADGLVYVTDLSGKLHCLEADTGKSCWVYESNAETWGGPLVADGKIYFGNRKGLHVLAAGKELRLLSRINLGAPAYSTPITANGVLYVNSQTYLWAVQSP